MLQTTAPSRAIAAGTSRAPTPSCSSSAARCSPSSTAKLAHTLYSFIQLDLPAGVGANGMRLHETTLITQTLLRYGIAMCYELHFGDVPYGHNCRECLVARLSSTTMF